MKKTLLLITSLFLLAILSGCGEKTTGDKVDDAIDSTKNASKEAWDDAKKALGN